MVVVAERTDHGVLKQDAVRVELGIAVTSQPSLQLCAPAGNTGEAVQATRGPGSPHHFTRANAGASRVDVFELDGVDAVVRAIDQFAVRGDREVSRQFRLVL